MKNIKAHGLRVKVSVVNMLLYLNFSLITISAQEGLNAAGGNESKSGGSVSYSIGQLVYNTHVGSNGSVAQGVQHPYEISVVTATEDAKKGISLLVSAYPNPTTYYLTLEVNEFELSNLQFQVTDLNGKLLQSGKIASRRFYIFMGNLAPSTYFVIINQGSKAVKIFKINKIKNE